MLKIGVTGGIGSGKTTVCKIFKLIGIPVYFADNRAKYLMVSNKYLIKEIKNIFGSNSYLENGVLNRKHIAKIAFNNKEKLEKLNRAVHPKVKDDFEQWVSAQNSPYIIKEAALLFETDSYKELDYNILVTAPLDMRIKRVIERDNIDKNSVLARVKNQMPEQDKLKLADYIIKNDNQQSLIHQILKLDKTIKKSNATIREF